jgi:hypothetical protein
MSADTTNEEANERPERGTEGGKEELVESEKLTPLPNTVDLKSAYDKHNYDDAI